MLTDFPGGIPLLIKTSRCKEGQRFAQYDPGGQQESETRAAPSPCSAQEVALPALLPGAGASCANTARPAVPVRTPPAQHHPVIKPKSSTLFCLLNFHPDCPFFQRDCLGQKPTEDIAYWHNFLLCPKCSATFPSLSCHPPPFPVFPYLSSDLSEKVSR